MLLSIGMIVKNEEKYLDRCLTALKPILENIDSELIIADTGSTDNTIEIAKRHTNNVLDFKWCNDFAAARNFTLEQSIGEWFMYLDADEILENADEIINFFRDTEYTNYDCARYLYKNYTSKDDKTPKEIYLHRMYKVKEDMHFEGIIHEHINDNSNCKTFSNTIIKHYGYSFDNLHEAKLKALRNIELLNDQIKKGNDSALVRNQLCDSYGLYKSYHQVIIHAKKGLELSISDEVLNASKVALYFNLISAYYNLRMFEEAITISKEYYKKDFILSTDIDVYYLISNCYYEIEDYNNAIIYYNKYCKMYQKDKITKLNTFETSFRPILFSNDKSFYNIIKVAINSYDKIKKYKELINIYKQNNYFINNEYIDDIKPFINMFLSASKKMKKYKFISLYYKYILKESNLKNTNEFEEILENFIEQNKKDKNKIISNFVNLNLNNKYLDFMKIRNSFYENNKTELNKLINLYIENFNRLTVSHSDIIYYILKENINIKNPLKLLKIIKSSNINNIIHTLYTRNNDFEEVVYNYNFNNKCIISTEIARQIYNYLLANIDNSSSLYSIKIYQNFINASKIYINEIYRNNILDTKNIYLTPQDIQFAFFCINAENEILQGNDLNYIKLLKIALQQCPEMKTLISLLLEEFDKNKKNSNKEINEFEELAKSIKNNIYMLINNKNLLEAKTILSEYRQINPNDKEILHIEKLMAGGI